MALITSPGGATKSVEYGNLAFALSPTVLVEIHDLLNDLLAPAFDREVAASTTALLRANVILSLEDSDVDNILADLVTVTSLTAPQAAIVKEKLVI